MYQIRRPDLSDHAPLSKRVTATPSPAASPQFFRQGEHNEAAGMTHEHDGHRSLMLWISACAGVTGGRSDRHHGFGFKGTQAFLPVLLTQPRAEMPVHLFLSAQFQQNAMKKTLEIRRQPLQFNQRGN